MARIRTIKPDFWTDGKVVSVSPYARLLFIGMWNFAMCDKGHVADDALKLKLQVLPIDNVDVPALITELINAGLIARISLPAENRTFLHVTRLADHQKVDGRWTPRCPVCTHSNSSKLTETHASLDETHRASPKLPETLPSKGKEGKVSKDMPIAKAKGDIDSEFEQWWKHYPRKVAKGEAKKAFIKSLKKADLPTLVDAVKAFAKTTEGKDATYIAYPSKWLNGERWLDDDILPFNEESLEEWLRDCWTNYNTAAVSSRAGLYYDPPDPPDDCEDVRAFNLQARRDWITANRDLIIAGVTRRENAA